MSDFPFIAPPPFPKEALFQLEFTRKEAQSLSLALSDLLCWHRGFIAARQGTDLDSNEPMGIEAVRTINLKLQRSF